MNFKNSTTNNCVCVIIPAFNEDKSISNVIRSIKAIKRNAFCLVVDDGSSDNTAKTARKEGASILRLNENNGTGHAIYKGLLYAKKHNFPVVITLDADGQHDPKNIPLLLKELSETNDMVIGSRYLIKTKNSTPYIRRLGTRIISMVFFYFLDIRIKDPTSGYRAMNKRTIDYFTHHHPTTFPEPEAIIALVRNGYCIKEISVEMKPRIYGSSTISMSKGVFLLMYIFYRVFREILKKY